MTHNQATVLKTAILAALVTSSIVPVAGATNCYVYRVNVQGNSSIGDATSISSSQPFWVTQYAIWCNSGVKGNPIEFWMTPFVDLNASPHLGFVEIMSNSVFARNPGIRSAQLNLAKVNVGQTLTFQFDYQASLQLPPPNVFAAPGFASVPGGLGGLCFLPSSGLCDLVTSPSVLSVSYIVPRRGGGQFNFPDGKGFVIAGSLDMTGTSVDNANFVGRYKANFSGNFVGSFQL
jgi:hypothetical protein